MQARLHTQNIALEGYYLKAIAVEYWDAQLSVWRTYDLIPMSTLTQEPELWHTLIRQQEALESMKPADLLDDVDWLNPKS